MQEILYLQCNITNYNHHKGAEIHGVSINTILPQALCLVLCNRGALTTNDVSHTLKETTSSSRVSSRQQTQTPLSGTECSWFSVCLCFVDSHLYKGWSESGRALTSVSQMLCTEAVLLQGHCILIRHTKPGRHNSILDTESGHILIPRLTHATAFNSSSSMHY